MISRQIDKNRFRKIYSAARRKSFIAYLSDTDPEISGSMVLSSLGINSVKDSSFGALGDGTTLDTNAIINALAATNDGEALFFPPGTYLCGNINISNKSNIEIFGWNATIQWTGSNNNHCLGFQLSNTCDNLHIHNLRFVGDTVESNLHTAIWSSSSQLTNINIEDLYILNTVRGISLDCSSSGYIRDSVVRNNRIDNVVGTDAGEGYGIFFADGSGVESRQQIINNRISRAQRQSVYCSRGKGVLIQGNMIDRHRNSYDDGAIRGAISIERSEDIICDSNIITNSYNTSIFLGSDNPSISLRNISVVNNHIVNPADIVNDVPHLVIGEDSPSGGIIHGVYVESNTIHSTGSATECIRLNYGHNLIVKNNNIFVYNGNASTRAINLYARGESSLTSLSSSNWYIESNIIKVVDSSNISTGNPIRLNDLWISSSIRTIFKDNIYNTPSSSFSLSSTPIVNPNVFIESDGIGIAFNTGSGTGYYPVRNSNNTTEDVAGLQGIILDNPAATSLSVLTNGFENQIITLWSNNANTTLVHGTQTNRLYFADGNNKRLSSGSSATFVRLNNVWRDTSVRLNTIIGHNSAYISSSLYVNGGEQALNITSSYDDVVIGNSSSSDRGLSIQAGTTSLAGVAFGDTSNGAMGYVAYNNANDQLIFGVSGSQRYDMSNTALFPTSNAGMSLGTSASRVHSVIAISGAFGAQLNSSADPSAADVVVGSLSAGHHGITIFSHSGSSGNLFFEDRTVQVQPYVGAIIYDHSSGVFAFVVESVIELLFTNTALLPGTDLGLALGGSSNRFGTVYAATASVGRVLNSTHPVYIPFSFSSLADTEAWVPLIDQVDTAASRDTVGIRLVCPHSGSINKVVVRSTTDLSTTVLRFYRNNNVLVSSGTQAVGSGSLVSFTGSSTWTFTPSDFIAISLDPTNSFSEIDGMLVLNYDLNS